MALGFRPIGPGDQAFLLEVYASTRREELALVDWSYNYKLCMKGKGGGVFLMVFEIINSY